MANAINAQDEDTKMEKKERAPWTAESGSITLALITIGLVAGWMLVTGTRTVFTEEVSTPKFWYTSAITLWVPFVIFMIQMVLLAKSALYSTHKEAAGTADVQISQWTFMAVVVIAVIWILLWALNKMGVSTFNMPLGPNHLSGLVAYVVTTGVESRVTNVVWTVANRRPGGTIGMN